MSLGTDGCINTAALWVQARWQGIVWILLVPWQALQHGGLSPCSGMSLLLMDNAAAGQHFLLHCTVRLNKEPLLQLGTFADMCAVCCSSRRSQSLERLWGCLVYSTVGPQIGTELALIGQDNQCSVQAQAVATLWKVPAELLACRTLASTPTLPVLPVICLFAWLCVRPWWAQCSRLCTQQSVHQRIRAHKVLNGHRQRAG